VGGTSSRVDVPWGSFAKLASLKALVIDEMNVWFLPTTLVPVTTLNNFTTLYVFGG
jgi:hypothetical protein